MEPVTDLPTPAFRYESLGDAKLQARIYAKAQEAKNHLGRGAIAAGKALAEAREMIPHGQWLPWLAAEFGASESTARRCLQVFERFGANPSRVTDLTSGVLYMLAAPSTPEAAVEAVLEQKAAGEPITPATVKEVVRRKKQPEEQPTAPVHSPQEASAGAVDLPMLHQKLASLATLSADLDKMRKTARSLLRLYARDEDLELAAAGLPGLVEQLDDAATYLARQLWPSGECPACHGARATIGGKCQACRGGGWATKQQINGSGRR
jgi:hypothetical protein